MDDATKGIDLIFFCLANATDVEVRCDEGVDDVDAKENEVATVLEERQNAMAEYLMSDLILRACFGPKFFLARKSILLK